MCCVETKKLNFQRPLILISFITATTRDGSQVTENRLQEISKVLKGSLKNGTALKCKEKFGWYQ